MRARGAGQARNLRGLALLAAFAVLALAAAVAFLMLAAPGMEPGGGYPAAEAFAWAR